MTNLNPIQKNHSCVNSKNHSSIMMKAILLLYIKNFLCNYMGLHNPGGFREQHSETDLVFLLNAGVGQAVSR